MALDRSFKHVARIQVATNLADVCSLALVDGRRVAGDDIDLTVASEIGDDVLGYPVGEAPRRLVTAEIVEGQHGDRGLR